MSRFVTFMTIDDAEHYTEAERQAIIAAYPLHERDARARGIPVLGSGRVFPIAEEEISVEPFKLPPFWPRLGALDFGWDHPSAAVELAYDTETDVIFVTKCYRASQQSPAMQAITLKPWGDWLPWAWPRDGHRETLEGAGIALARQYREHGLRMLGTHAQFKDGSVSVEAGLMMMLDRMQTNRFKVFSTLNDWFEEFRLYHRAEGRVVKLRDDLMCLHGDTTVITEAGPRRIADMVGTTGRVLTVGNRWTAYRDCRKTRLDAPVYRLKFSNGSVVVATGNHRFLTPKGWVKAFDMLGHFCHSSVSPREYGEGACASSSSIMTLRSSTARPTSALAGIFEDAGCSFTAMCGRITTALFRPVTMSTTSIATGPTTRSRTSTRSMGMTIFRCTKRATAGGPMPLSRQWPSGARPRKASGMHRRWAEEMLTSCISRATAFVSSAANTTPWRGGPGFAAMPASPNGGVYPGSIMSRRNASSAPALSHPTATKRPLPARPNARALSAVESGAVCLSVSEAGTADVYCMAVPETEAFAVEGGLIVHNCATRYGATMIREALVEPRVLRMAKGPNRPRIADPLADFRR
jgi:hypothetical protein